MLTYDKSPAPFYGSVHSAPLSTSSIPLPKMGKAISRPVHRHLFIVTGPAGCGKSTVAKFLAESQDFPYIEGDEVGLPILPGLLCVHANLGISSIHSPMWTR
jgi:gluconokinase